MLSVSSPKILPR